MGSKKLEALRWKNHLASLCFYMLSAFMMGASPLVDKMNSEVSEMSASLYWLAPGITTFATLNFCTNLVIMPVVGSVMKLLKYKGILIWLTSLSGTLFPLSIGIAISTKRIWIAYIGAVLASPAYMITLEAGKVMVVQWWALDGKQCSGVALFGVTAGSMFLLMTLFLGYACQYWGVAWTAYAVAMVFVIASLWPLYLALRGELGPPPPLSPVGVKAGMPEVKAREWLCSFSLCQICFHNLATFLPCFGMKILLTSIYQTSYAVSFLTSSKTSALTMILYVVARGVFTYLAKPGYVMPMEAAMLMLTGVLYGSYSTIIQYLPIWCLTVAKSVAGGCFAGISGMQSLLLLEVYEPQELPSAFAKSEPFLGIAFTFGPAIGYYLNLLQKSRGVADRHTYDLFFYISALLHFAAVANIAVLHARLSARFRKIKAPT